MFKPHFGQCIDCPPNTSRFLVVKAGLCRYHNELRKGNNIRNKIKPMSRSKQERTQRKLEAYKAIDATRPMICTGCGCTDKSRLSHSHLIPVSHSSFFEDNPVNIEIQCMDWMGKEGCHTKWESRDLKKMNELRNIDALMMRVKTLDLKYFFILTKGEDIWKR